MTEPSARDTEEVISTLHSALSASGLSQALFARALGTSASRLSTYLTGGTSPSARFLVRARRLGSALGTARERRVMSPPVAAIGIRKSLLSGDIAWAWRLLLQARDHLRDALQARDDVLIDAWEAEPSPTGSAGWDALLAALAAREFEEAGRVAPAWTDHEVLPQPWMPDHPFLSPERVRDQTPTWLRRQNIWVPERDLSTA